MRNRSFVIPPSSTPSAMPRTVHRLDPQRGYVQNEDPTQPFPEGDVVVPEACWFQHPEAPKISRFYQPQRQWGDRKVLVFPPLPLGGQLTQLSQQLLDLRLDIPAVCLVRLSSVELSGGLTALTPNAVTTWTLDLGCGRSLQIKTVAEQIATADGANSTDIALQVPIQALRVSASVFVKNNVPEFVVECVAQVAPFTSYPGMVDR